MWTKHVVYQYIFYSDILSDCEIEDVLRYEINGMKENQSKNIKIYRADCDDFSINKRTITFSRNTVLIASKKRLMKELQKRIDAISLIKKYKDLLG